MQLELSTLTSNDTISDDERWQAVLSRDARYDGAFIYGVLSTRIFCCPTCPARRPKRDGVRFFADAQTAAQNGFRACKRCCPDEAHNALTAMVQRALRVLDVAETTVSLAELASQIGVSASYLQRTFTKIVGISPREYANTRRLKNMKTNLQNGERILDAQNDAGYGSSRALYESANSHLGMTPATYAKGGIGAQIRFDVAPCPLGVLLVATTDKGVCSVTLGDAPEKLEAELRAEFPHATIQRDAENLRDAVNHTLRVLEGAVSGAQMPLDVIATSFQWRVWRVLQTLQRGETLSYAQLAAKIGQPTAARAVARACATNPVALLVPCHRIVGKNGALSGYRWGIERKRKLLDEEIAREKARNQREKEE